MVDEQEIKEEMSIRPKTDHFSIESGSAAKGTKVALKTYYDALDIDDAQKRIEHTLKIRQYLIDKKIIE